MNIELECSSGKYNVDKIISDCPHCSKRTSFKLLCVEKSAYKFQDYYPVYCFVLQCMDCECKATTVSVYYKKDKYFIYISSFPKQQFKEQIFSKPINDTSKSFAILYNQSLKTEHEGCQDIAGAGYRKAIEFLIKDYSIKNNPDDTKAIKEMFLATVIEKYIDYSKLKEIAKRAVWLGNDATHYEKIWTDKDIHDLKNTINIIVHYITMEEEASKYIDSMEK